MVNGPSDALLLDTFGPRLLAYLANVDEAQIDVRFRDGVPLRQEAELALSQLLPLAERVARERLDHPGLPVALSLEVLGAVPAGSDMSVGNAIRVAAGGDVESAGAITAAEGDEVKALLFRLARDAYPQLLVPVEEPWHRMHLSFFRHPQRAELQRAVHEDERLSRMYPSEDGDLGRRGEIVNSLGRGGTIQSVSVGATLIHAAWDLALMSKPSPSLADLYEAVSESVDVLRAAVAGEATRTPALLAFTGITTAGRSIDTPWGSLRPITDHERRSAPSMLEGSVSGTDADGRSITVSYAGEVVLATKLPFALTVHAWDPGDEHPDWPRFENLRPAHALRRRSEGVQLAVLLAIDRPAGQWATARFSWQWIADPSSQGRSIGWADPRSSPGFMPTELSEGECEALQRWCALVESHHGGAFNEAAIAERADRALDLARSSLRILFRDRNDVLSLPDGSARSLKLILDA